LEDKVGDDKEDDSQDKVNGFSGRNGFNQQREAIEAVKDKIKRDGGGLFEKLSIELVAGLRIANKGNFRQNKEDVFNGKISVD